MKIQELSNRLDDQNTEQVEIERFQINETKTVCTF